MTGTPHLDEATSACSSTAGWMDLDNAWQRRLHPDQPRFQPDPRLRLRRLRKTAVRTVAEQTGQLRTLRVITYALVQPNRSPEPDHARLAEYAKDAKNTWHVKYELHDETPNLQAAPDPQHRNGWLMARRLLRTGAADGVLAVSREVISPDDTSYYRELCWIGDHSSFLELLIAEDGT